MHIHSAKMADKEGLVAQFMAITGVDTDRATFYLESAGWNLDVSFLVSSGWCFMAGRCSALHISASAQRMAISTNFTPFASVPLRQQHASSVHTQTSVLFVLGSLGPLFQM